MIKTVHKGHCLAFQNALERLTKCQHCLLFWKEEPKATCEFGSRKGREFCAPEPQLRGCAQACTAHHAEMKQGLGDTRAPRYNTRVAPIVLSRMSCQDVIRPLELNWKNVGELCNYNHNLCSGLHYCNANARQGGGENKVKGQQKGAVFTFNINQESGAGTGKVQEIKQSPL